MDITTYTHKIENDPQHPGTVRFGNLDQTTDLVGTPRASETILVDLDTGRIISKIDHWWSTLWTATN